MEILIIVLAIGALVWGGVGLQRERRLARQGGLSDQRPGCATCLYPLGGWSSPRCPECGQDASEKGVRIGGRERAIVLGTLIAGAAVVALGVAGAWLAFNFFSFRDAVTTQSLALEPDSGVAVTLVSRSHWQPRPRSFDLELTIDLLRTPSASSASGSTSVSAVKPTAPSIGFQAAAPDELPTLAQLEAAFRTLLQTDPEDASGRPLSERAAVVLHDLLAPDRIWEESGRDGIVRTAAVVHPYTSGGWSTAMFWRTSWIGTLVRFVPALVGGAVAWHLVQRRCRSLWWRPARPEEWATVEASRDAAVAAP